MCPNIYKCCTNNFGENRIVGQLDVSRHELGEKNSPLERARRFKLPR